MQLSILGNLECMVYLAFTFFYISEHRRYTCFMKRERKREREREFMKRERKRGMKAHAGSLVVRFVCAKYLSQVVVGIER